MALAPAKKAPAVAARPDARFLPAVLLFVLIGLAWSNTFSAPFAFDDHASILDNPTIRQLWPATWLHPPASAGETVSGRPFLNFTFALNYAIGGLAVRGYHAVNLLIHFLAGLTLFAIVRRTRPGDTFALCIALFWTLHPLQTEAVTYIVQRAESLAALLILLALYSFIRGASAGSAAAPGRTNKKQPRAAALPGFTLAIIFTLLAVATKETAAVAPVLILLYDRTFLAGSFRAAWRARHRVHLGLFATWIPLAALILANHSRGGSAGANTAIPASTYLLTQSHAVLRYLALTFWPRGQVFDYGIPTMTTLSAALPALLVLALLLGATGWACWRNLPAGFLGATFFLALMPSSSVVPIATQTIAEHRMYLALAAPVILVCSAGRRLLARSRLLSHESEKPGASKFLRFAPTLVVSGLILALGATTHTRNDVYRSSLSLWHDTVAKRADNPRAHHNLGLALLQTGHMEEAAAEFRRAIALQPNHAYAHFQLGTLALSRRDWTDAAVHFEAALAADPHYVSARINLGQALSQLGRPDEAIAQYRSALSDDPGAQDARTLLAALYLAQHRLADAIALLREVLAATPEFAEAHYHLGLALDASGSISGAESELREAIRLKPAFAPSHLALGHLLAHRGDAPAAEAAYRAALGLDPRNPETHHALGTLLAKQRRFDAAMAAFRDALALAPAHLQARNNLANCQLITGRVDEAIANYEEILRLHPANETARRNLHLAREMKTQK
jgi:tetratricopeptide (TPR) repeat protein